MNNKKITFAILAGAILFIGISLAVFFYNQAEESKVAENEKPLIGETRVDPVSGETITDSTREHEPAAQVIAMIGFDELLDVGLGIDQYGLLENKMMLLNDQLSYDVTMASMYKDSAVATYRDEGEKRTQMIEFKMQLNEKEDYAATIEYRSLSTLVLKVYTADRSKLLYTL